MTPHLDVALLVAALVLLVAVGAVRVSTRLGLPSLLVYLALGLVIGEAGLGIRFDDAPLTRTLGTYALALIIAEGGLTARWSAVRPVLGVSVALATVGVTVSIGLVGLVVHLLLDLPWRTALLYGAVLSSTDAAAVFSTLRRLRLRPRVVAILETESGLNDAPVVLIVVLLSSTGPATGTPWWTYPLVVLYELAAGAVVGLAVGFAGAWLVRRSALPAAGLYPLSVVGLTVLAYTTGNLAHASGFLAVYVAGVILGNSRLPHRQAILGFADGLAWLAQIGLFVLLGLLASPDDMAAAVGPALLVGLVLLVLARPASVVVSTAAFRVPWREQGFLSWAGLRGAVPIVLSTIPLAQRLPGATRLFNVVFVLVVVFTVVQGTTLARVARRLRVREPAAPTELRVETAPLERMRADLLEVTVPDGSRLAGVFVAELRLPEGAVVTLVLREGVGFVPDSNTRLRPADTLLIVATEQARNDTERRLRAVSQRGRLARWLADPETRQRRQK